MSDSEVVQFGEFAFSVTKYSGDSRVSKTARWEITNKFGVRIEVYFDFYFDADNSPKIFWPTFAPRNLEQSTEFAQMILFACKIAKEEINNLPSDSLHDVNDNIPLP